VTNEKPPARLARRRSTLPFVSELTNRAARRKLAKP
jgi:hypothetical protein